MKDIILEKVAQHCNVGMNDMCSPSRLGKFVKARHLFFYFARKYTKLSLKEIGATLYRDYATVLHGYSSISNQLQSYSYFRKEIYPLDLDIKNSILLTEVYDMPSDVWGENDFYN